MNLAVQSPDMRAFTGHQACWCATLDLSGDPPKSRCRVRNVQHVFIHPLLPPRGPSLQKDRLAPGPDVPAAQPRWTHEHSKAHLELIAGRRISIGEAYCT